MPTVEYIVHNLRTFGRHVNSDGLDHLHFFVTSNALILLSSLTAAKTYSGSPLECITPPMFPSSWNTGIRVPLSWRSGSIFDHLIT
uniref:Innexin n=1 Tax=Steinernema glaseri TaxID=37863 RepID=A0A1I8A8X7_9BILA